MLRLVEFEESRDTQSVLSLCCMPLYLVSVSEPVPLRSVKTGLSKPVTEPEIKPRMPSDLTYQKPCALCVYIIWFHLSRLQAAKIKIFFSNSSLLKIESFSGQIHEALNQLNGTGK